MNKRLHEENLLRLALYSQGYITGLLQFNLNILSKIY